VQRKIVSFRWPVVYIGVLLVLSFVLLMTVLQPGLPTKVQAGNPAQIPVSYLLHTDFFNNLSAGGKTYTTTLSMLNPGAAQAAAVLEFSSVPAIYDTKAISAGGTLIVPSDSVAGLPSGLFSLKVSSDQPLQSVVDVHRSVGDKLGVYRGVSSGSTRLAFPFIKDWGLTVWNTSMTTANVLAQFYNTDGTLAYTPNTQVVSSGRQASFSGPALSGLPASFVGWVRISSDQDVTGLVNRQKSGSDEVFDFQGPLGAGAVQAFMPRAFKNVDEGGGPRSTTLFVGNVVSVTAHATLSYHSANGSLTYATTFDLPVSGARFIRLLDETNLPASGDWSVVLTSNQPVVLSEWTDFDAATTYSSGAYGSEVGSDLYLPRVARTAGDYTVFSLENVGAVDASVTITYSDQAGSPVYAQVVTLQPGAWVRYDQSQMTQLPLGFEGSAHVVSNQPGVAWVDEYVFPPCEPPSNLIITRTPAGDVFVTDPVTFSVTANGSTPMTYAWTVDGTPVNWISPTLYGIFIVAGDFTVGVTVTNDCGSSAITLPITIKPLLPDLSASYKLVSQGVVDIGDVVTYTLVLRNTGRITATAVLTDPIPGYTTYVAGSAHASDGSPVTVTSSELHWAGPVVSGTAVLVRFAVQVQAAPVGTVITNIAMLDDGAGAVTQLSANSVFNPGYRLSINDGALATNIPTVTLRYAWNSNDGITQVWFSNDGGFASGTGWISVNLADPVYTNWVLATYGDLKLPRTVYARFRNAGGTPFGPIQDDIIYDFTPPQVTQVEILTQTQRTRAAVENSSVIVRVTAGDDNSGVGAIQISDYASFAPMFEYAVTSQTTDISWTLQSSGLVYVRALDQAGNASPVVVGREPGRGKVYLPLVVR
jgi:uncharacterized repeat protein (TIGR01451 family)